MKFDREKLSDTPADSIKLAQEIILQARFSSARTPLYEIAYGLGIYDIQEKPLKGIEGSLIVPPGKFEGAILINSAQDKRRKRFTIAHELGHFVHPLHHPENNESFECKSSHMQNLQSNPEKENQANIFAAELLLPTAKIKAFVTANENPSLEDIFMFSESHDVSMAATIRSISKHLQKQTIFMFHENNLMRYFDSTPQFSFPKFKKHLCLSENCFAFHLKQSPNSFSKTYEVAAKVWIKHPSASTITEQTFTQENGHGITMLNL